MRESPRFRNRISDGVLRTAAPMYPAAECVLLTRSPRVQFRPVRSIATYSLRAFGGSEEDYHEVAYESGSRVGATIGVDG